MSFIVAVDRAGTVGAGKAEVSARDRAGKCCAGAIELSVGDEI